MKNLTSMDTFISEKKWISKAIKNKGSLRAELGKEEDEKITNADIEKVEADLKRKDKDKEEPGLQLDPKDAKTHKRVTLFKTLKKLGEDFSTEIPLVTTGGIESPEDVQDGGEEEEEERLTNYMFFSNLKNIMSMCEEILAMNDEEVDAKLTEGHSWAVDHIATSTDDINEVYNFLRGEEEDEEEDLSKAPANFLECEE